MEFGREIAVNGARPDWLADDVSLRLRECGGDFYDDVFEARAVDWHSELEAVRLPVDHFAYKALDAGFQPWGGGDAAPADWDQEAPLLRNGFKGHVRSWKHDVNDHSELYDVIGYRKRAEPKSLHDMYPEHCWHLPPADTVTIARMTEAEALCRFVMPPRKCMLDMLRSLGLIREETLAERFTRETGFEVTDAVEAALNWSGK